MRCIAQNTAKYCETLWCDVLHKILWRGAGQIVIVAKSGLQWTRERGWVVFSAWLKAKTFGTGKRFKKYTWSPMCRNRLQFDVYRWYSSSSSSAPLSILYLKIISQPSWIRRTCWRDKRETQLRSFIVPETDLCWPLNFKELLERLGPELIFVQ